MDPDVNAARFQDANLAFLIESEVTDNGSGGLGRPSATFEPVLADHMVPKVADRSTLLMSGRNGILGPQKLMRTATGINERKETKRET